MTEKFEFPGKLKMISLILFVIGLVCLGLGLVVYGDDHHGVRVWANLLLNSYYSVGIGLGAMFFIASHQLGYSGWHTAFRRVPEAMMSFIPFGGIFLLIIGGSMLVMEHGNPLYHWAHAPGDEIIAGKSLFLNSAFFFARIAAYVVLWSLLGWLLRKASLNEDKLGPEKTYQKSKYLAAIVIVILAVTSSSGAWDFIMSIDAHWYSTLFGWYNFASYVVACFATMILLIIYLKSQGKLEKVNHNHLHDLGKYLFGFSVFWTYLWFAQFLLIWYGNIPEATQYFATRWDSTGYSFVFYLLPIINFGFPFLILMARDSKRNTETLAFAAIVLIIGHWVDFYLMIMPGSAGESAGFGWLEIGSFLGFVGLFTFVVLGTLSRNSLVASKNPYLKESLQHHI